MAKKLNNFLLISVILLLLVSISAPSLSWFAEYIIAEFPDVKGSTAVSYFESGDGSPEKPYVISRPVHLYNLAWLQYIGYFNLADINNGRAQNYFRLKENIDMTGLAIPPIGTTEYPFLGIFDGNGKVISNLTVANAKSLLAKRPSNSKFNAENADLDELLSNFEGGNDEAGAVMGFFGVVGDYDGAVSVIEAKDSSFDESKITVKNTAITAYELISSSDATTVGFVAGYVNAPVLNILVNNCKLTVEGNAQPLASITENISDHALVGFCTAEYASTLDVNEVDISDPVFESLKDINGALGTDANWGGSLAMSELYQNLVSVRDGNSVGVPDYAYQAVKVMSADGKSFCAVERVTTGYMHMDNAGFKDKYGVVYPDGSLSLEEFFMLGGGAMLSTVVCHETENSVSANYVKYGDKYLTVTLGGGAPELALADDEASAAKWVVDNGALFVLAEGCKLYVNVSSENISFSYLEKTSTGWSYVDEKGLCYTSGDKAYYLKLINNEWVLREETNTAQYYLIRSGDNYLNVSENKHQYLPYNLAENYNTSDPQDPNITHWYCWKIEGDFYNIYIEVGGTKYALVYNDPFVLNDKAYNSVPWEIRGSNLYLGQGYPNGYLAFVNGSWTFSTNVADAAEFVPVTPADDGTAEEWTRVTTAAKDMSFDVSGAGTYNRFEYGVANKHDATYIPLQKNSDGTPTANNTGYITSGMYNQLNSNPQNGPQQPQQNTGDVRMSAFYKENIRTPSQVYTWDAESGQFVQISTDPSTFAENSLGASLKKYQSSVEAYKALLEDSRLYGLQFTDGIISTDSLITVKSAQVNGRVIADFDVPGDCIDFTLKKDGYINFYAGTYYPGTDCFFSLHHISRGENMEITAIKEISLIYKSISDPDADYVYRYTDGTYSVNSFSDSDYTVIFNTEWLTNPSNIDAPDDAFITSDNMNEFEGETYYFEIPVNAGEYALGSVQGKTGACLLYLDIGASLQEAPVEVDRTVIEEVFVESSNTYSYALGVGMMDGEAYTELGNAYVSFTLPDGFGTSLQLVREGNVITAEPPPADGGASLNAVGGSLTVDGMQASPISSESIVTKRVTYVDIDRETDTESVTVITYRDENSNGKIDTGEVTVTDGDGNDISEAVSLSNTDSVTSIVIPTKPTGDTVDWETISAATTPALSYKYQASAGASLTNSIEFDPAGKKYLITVESSEAITITVTDVNTSDSFTGASFNGSTADVGAGDTFEISPAP